MIDFKKLMMAPSDEVIFRKDVHQLSCCKLLMSDVKENNLTWPTIRCTNQLVYNLLENLSTISTLIIDMNKYQHLRIYDEATDMTSLLEAKRYLKQAEESINERRKKYDG